MQQSSLGVKVLFWKYLKLIIFLESLKKNTKLLGCYGFILKIFKTVNWLFFSSL